MNAMNAATTPRSAGDERLVVLDAERATARIKGARVADLGRFLRQGDLVVLNDSATLPASIPGLLHGRAVEARLARRVQDEGHRGRFWAVLFGEGDFRTRTEKRALPPPAQPGDTLHALGMSLRVVHVDPEHPRFVEVDVVPAGTGSVTAAIVRAAHPVQYAYIPKALETWDVQTSFATRPWSFEMPSATRPLTWARVRELRARGIGVVALSHGAGLSSTGDARLDARLPLPEPYEIPHATADAVNATRARGGRVIAAGTSVVRALESSADLPHNAGRVTAETRETSWRAGPETTLRVVNGILTGLHVPGESHFDMLQAFASRADLERALGHASRIGCHAHEFGDAMLVLR